MYMLKKNSNHRNPVKKNDEGHIIASVCVCVCCSTVCKGFKIVVSLGRIDRKIQFNMYVDVIIIIFLVLRVC